MVLIVAVPFTHFQPVGSFTVESAAFKMPVRPVGAVGVGACVMFTVTPVGGFFSV